MSLVLRPILAFFLAALLIFPAACVFAEPEIMPVDQLKAGMHGVAKTVVSGTQIEEFNVEILGVMKDKGPSGDLILIRASGDVIDRTGGIAQGMSGSPVYIDDKLVGAVAYGFGFTDHRVGMLTPIGDMLKLWNNPDNKKSVFGDNAEMPELTEEATPLMAAGFSDGALEMLRTKLKALNLAPYAVGAAPSDTDYKPLEPGSAVGVELVRGDATLGAMGTVTYVEDNKVLAFGHPFLKKGVSNYFLSNGYVFTTVNGLENSFKLGVTGPLLGMISQDRGAGIAGLIGTMPKAIPIGITVKDLGTGVSRDASVQVVQDEQLSPVLAAASVFSIIEKTTDRAGLGTAKVSFEITAKNMPGEVFKRENMFYSPTNINELAVSELHELLALLASNQFQVVEVTDVKVNVTVESQRLSAVIMKAKPAVATAKPGDKIGVNVTLKPYRGEAITKTVYFTVPQDQPSGPLTLEVRGGGTVPLIELLKKQITEGEVLKMVGKLKNQTFDEMLKEMAVRDHNNDIVVEILDTDFGEGYGDQLLQTGGQLDLGKAGGKKGARSLKNSADAKKDDEKAKNFLSTDYIIDSDTQVVINIVKSDNEGLKKPYSNQSTRDNKIAGEYH